MSLGPAFKVFGELEVPVIDSPRNVRDTWAVVKQELRMLGLALYGHDKNGQVEHDVVGRIQGRAGVLVVVERTFKRDGRLVGHHLAHYLTAKDVLDHMVKVERHVCRTRA